MRKRLLVIVVLVLALTSIGTAAIAHDDEGQQAFFAVKVIGFIQAAQQAAENSNAPQSHVPCVKGYAGEFPCHKIDMLSHIPPGELGTVFVNDIWGWTDSRTGNDYALLGMAEGMSVIDISDPKRPEIIGMLPTHSEEGGFFWRDIKVYDDHAFVVSEHTGHGVQVLDLTQVRTADTSGGPVVFAETAHYDLPDENHAHNIAINEDTGFAYVVGTDDCNGGLHIVDISDPTNPSNAGCFGDDGYVHDTQCVIYSGPDAEHQGKEICFNSNGNVPDPNTLSIVDVTDKSNMVSISNTPYGEAGYSHQGWLTPDQRYFLHGDELDEFFGVISNTRTRVWDLTDLDNPTVIENFDNATTSIDHNIYVEGRYAFASNYTSGLRVYDTRGIGGDGLSEVAYFDVYPENDVADFIGGTWSNYPYFSQKGVVAVSSIDRGLFILQPRVGKSGN